jgi:hypothetical protein
MLIRTQPNILSDVQLGSSSRGRSIAHRNKSQELASWAQAEGTGEKLCNLKWLFAVCRNDGTGQRAKTDCLDFDGMGCRSVEVNPSFDGIS